MLFFNIFLAFVFWVFLNGCSIFAAMDLQDFIRTVPDFPKKGIVYRDITPLFLNPEAVAACVEQIVDGLPKGAAIDKVVGVEARGFFLATLVAQKLGAGFVPVRKAGKLPFDTLQQHYNLEYGDDRLEIHRDAIKPGERILIHDDVLATGGTALAACNLVERLEGEIVQCNFLIELDALEGRQKLQSYDVESLWHY